MAQQDSVETLDHDDDPQSQSQAQAQANDPITSSSTTTTTTCDSDPRSLSRNLSSSRLNAKAPEFVPSSSSSATAKTRPGRNHNHHQSRVVIPPPPQPSPTGLVHVYNAPNSPYHVPIVPVPVPVPVQHHHPYPHPHHPIHYHQNQNHHNHHRQFYQEVAVVQPQQQAQPPVDSDPVTPSTRNGNGLTDEATQKIISQVEYYFSDVNLATTDHLMRFINKDPEGCVPISVVASFKKIKTLISSNSQLATILRNSAKLVVSEDGKKVRRQLPLTESDMEELQSRIVVAENLPEDHCYQNLMKIFSSVGSVKTIRTCQPQTSNGGASSASRTAKAEGMLFSNKLHAFVEYESMELAEKAVSELNEEGNWRNGLRVRLLLRRTTKPTQARVKKVGHEGEAHRKEDDTSTSDQQDPNEKQHLEDPSQQPDMQSPQSNGHAGEEQANGKEVGGQKKSRSRGRAKGRGRQQYHHNHRGGHHVGPPPSSNSEQQQQQQQQPALGKQQPPGPRMPDGTRGFSLGRGKPIAVSIA